MDNLQHQRLGIKLAFRLSDQDTQKLGDPCDAALANLSDIIRFLIQGTTPLEMEMLRERILQRQHR
jgi:hypothetical protein